MRGFFLAIVGLVLASASTAQVPASQSGKRTKNNLRRVPSLDK
jgi:hypothetical protein